MRARKSFAVCICATTTYTGFVEATDEEEAEERAWQALSDGALAAAEDEHPTLALEEADE